MMRSSLLPPNFPYVVATLNFQSINPNGVVPYDCQKFHAVDRKRANEGRISDKAKKSEE